MIPAKQVYFDALSGKGSLAPHRSLLTRKPDWSFAGNLKAKSDEIMELVSCTVETGLGPKDDLPLIYISNPPRHGKSLLLDSLFQEDPAVCVLNATYNAGTFHREEEWSSPEGAVCGLLVRLLHDLAIGHPTSWTSSWDQCPLTKLLPRAIGEHNPSCLVCCFEEMLQLRETGFTDNPVTAVAASDISCHPMSCP
ncbi:hypothetical protein EON64_12045 [archaeon]|nr:MAG: hypothetical protein EON64_12045 [archaeon]